MGLVAHFSESVCSEKRGDGRRTLRLEVDVGRADGSAVSLTIHDLSATGFLVQTIDGASIGEELHIELPDGGLYPARVVWSSGNFVGCVFDQTLPKAAVSAALLRSVRPEPDWKIEAGGSYARDLQARVNSFVDGLAEADSGKAIPEKQFVSDVDCLPIHTRGRILIGLSAISAGFWVLLSWSVGLI